ncbi:MAG: hypothetical protein LBQ34_06680 [Alphaproteobacteria bacterium]|jgi:hypothetical protein|nr:hypothetical protein [Alphaproteobacteria bacterium]
MARQNNLFENLPKSTIQKMLTDRQFQSVKNRRFVKAGANKADVLELRKMLEGVFEGEIYTMEEFQVFFENLARRGRYNLVRFIDPKKARGVFGAAEARQLQYKFAGGRNPEAQALFEFKPKQMESVLADSMDFVEKYFNELSSDLGLSADGTIDTTKAKDIKELKASYKERAFLISQCEVARTNRKASTEVAGELGITEWMWGQSSADHPSESHEVLVGKISPVGETPDPDNYFPGERANCQCEMIFINRYSE